MGCATVHSLIFCGFTLLATFSDALVTSIEKSVAPQSVGQTEIKDVATVEMLQFFCYFSHPFRRAPFGDGSLRKLTKRRARSRERLLSQTLLSGLMRDRRCISLLKGILPFGKVERFLDAKERNEYESRLCLGRIVRNCRPRNRR